MQAGGLKTLGEATRAMRIRAYLLREQVGLAPNPNLIPQSVSIVDNCQARISQQRRVGLGRDSDPVRSEGCVELQGYGDYACRCVANATVSKQILTFVALAEDSPNAARRVQTPRLHSRRWYCL